MALVPLDRPAGSTQVLRYRGAFAVGNANANVYPKVAAEIPLNSTITGSFFDAYVRFPLFDAVTPATTTRKLPAFVYDDEQPSEDAPHLAVACAASATPGVNTTDLSLNAKTWAQNLELTFVEDPATTPLVLSATAYIAQGSNPAAGAQIVLDNATTSGLGTGTGLPVLIVHFRVLANDGDLQAFSGTLTIEVRHSNHR